MYPDLRVLIKKAILFVHMDSRGYFFGGRHIAPTTILPSLLQDYQCQRCGVKAKEVKWYTMAYRGGYFCRRCAGFHGLYS